MIVHWLGLLRCLLLDVTCHILFVQISSLLSKVLGVSASREVGGTRLLPLFSCRIGKLGWESKKYLIILGLMSVIFFQIV